MTVDAVPHTSKQPDDTQIARAVGTIAFERDSLSQFVFAKEGEFGDPSIEEQRQRRQMQVRDVTWQVRHGGLLASTRSRLHKHR
jgi:hypothetical protein